MVVSINVLQAVNGQTLLWTKGVIVQRTNKILLVIIVLAVLFIALSLVSCGKKEFTVEKGYGLNHYVSYLRSIDLAEEYDLPIYYGKVQTEQNRITPAYARDLESLTDQVQVTVGVVEGDHFVVLSFGRSSFVPSKLRHGRQQ